MQAKLFCQNSGDTNEWAAKLLGERYIDITSTNVGRSGTEGQSQSSGISRSEQRRYFVEPSRFTTLKRGGEQHNFQVEAIVYNGGHRFHWNNTRQAWQHPCGTITDERADYDPRKRYGSYFAADRIAA